MIYLDREVEAPEQDILEDSPYSDFVVAEFRHRDRGYLVEITPGSNFRYIRFEPGLDSYRSEIYGTELAVLEAILQDNLQNSKILWGSDLWMDDLILAIAALQPLAPDTPCGKAAARFAKRQVAFYGDAELGYIVSKTLLGKYRFIHYDGNGEEVSDSFPTEFDALEAVYDDCLRQNSRHRDMPWAQNLYAVVEAEADARRSEDGPRMFSYTEKTPWSKR